MKQFHFLKVAFVTLITMISGYTSALAISCGTYTVGPGGDFPDLSAAVTDLNGSTITCPIVLNILPGSYSGTTWQAEFANISGASSSNTITIQPLNGVGTVSISVAGSSSANYVLRLNDASYITVKNLTLINTTSGGTGEGRVIDIAGSSSYNTIQGCVLTGAAGAATSVNRAIVLMGTSSAPLTGSDNAVVNNTITNGYCAVYMYGTSITTPTQGNVVSNNTVVSPYTFGIYTYYAGNARIESNVISGTATTFTHAIYTGYNQNGGSVSNNTITMNTTSGDHYGIYNAYQNSSTSTAAFINNNNVSIVVTTGGVFPIYNAYSQSLSINDNTFTGSATSGKVDPPTLMYYCKSSVANNNVFNYTVTTGSIGASAFYFMSYADGCRVENNIFNFNSTSGSQFTTTTNYVWMDYATSTVCRANEFNFTSTTGAIGKTTTAPYSGLNYTTNAAFNKNKFTLTTSSTSTIYGTAFWAYYTAYGAANSSIDSNTFVFNLNAAATRYLYGYYMYYTGTTGGGSFSNNSVTVNCPNSSSTYCLPYATVYSSHKGGKVNNNVVTINQTSGTIYPCGYYGIYSAPDGQYNNNIITVNPTSATIYVYYAPLIAATTSEAKNNVFDMSTTGSFYFYGGNYQGSSLLEGNTFNMKYGTGYMYYGYYLYGTSRNNTYNFTGGNTTLYGVYYPQNGKFLNNTVNVNSTGTIYNYEYYPSGVLVANNKFNFTTTSGAIYNLYQAHGSSSYSSSYYNNIFDLRSNSGTIYAYYPISYPGKFTFVGNVVSTKTSGTSYMYYNNYGNAADQVIANNTYHSNSTNATNNNFWYQTGGSTSYPGKAYVYNNIFTRANAASANAFDVNDTAYFKSDYNLLYSPGTVNVKMGNPSITTSDLGAWKTTTGMDMNSLFNDPGYINAANFDFRPNPTNPNSWAVQGRGIHIEGDTTDILGNPRAKTRFDGVPDLGAYEFTPTVDPPVAVAIPANPVANSVQKFLFGGDTVCSIEWGSTVPTSVAVKQYTGLQANVVPSITERMYFYVDVQTPLGVYEYKPRINYKDPWLGDISKESVAKIAKSSNGGAWAGYNYHNGVTDSFRNTLMPADQFDSLSSRFTGVENGRIGIRCIVPPFGLQHYDVTAFAATEQWEPVFVPIGYQVIVDSVHSPLNLSMINFTSTNNPPKYPINNLAENTTYYVNVRTICGVNDTSDWSIDSFRTMITCHAPNINATSITHNQAVVYWDTIQTAIAYEYRLDQSPADPSFGTKITTNSAFAGGLKPGTKYYAHVRSHCSTIYDISGWSTFSFTTGWPASVKDLDGAPGITAYPNPVKDIVTINLVIKPGSGATITVTDIAGKVVYNTPVAEQGLDINMSNMPSGMYIIRYIDNERTEQIKITKE